MIDSSDVFSTLICAAQDPEFRIRSVFVHGLTFYVGARVASAGYSGNDL